MHFGANCNFKRKQQKHPACHVKGVIGRWGPATLYLPSSGCVYVCRSSPTFAKEHISGAKQLLLFSPGRKSIIIDEEEEAAAANEQNQ